MPFPAAFGRVTSNTKAVTPTPRNLANRMVKTALIQYSCVSSQRPTSFSGNNGSTGTMKTISVIAGDSVSTRSASHCLKVRSRYRRHRPGHDRFKVIPQPSLDQEDDREQNPERLKQAAQHEYGPRPA